MTKGELEILVEKQEKEIEKLKELKEYKKRNEELVREAFEYRKKIDKLEGEADEVKKTHGILTTKYNSLAQLFDEHIKAYDDVLEVNKLFLRSALRTQELVNSKIKAFNGEGGKE